MSNAPNPDPAPDEPSADESADDEPDADHEDDETGGTLRTALGALRARLSPSSEKAPEDAPQPDD